MAAQQPPTGQRAATPGALLLQGLQRIGRTGGLEATGIAQPGLEQQTVASNQQHQKLPWQVNHNRGYLSG